MSEEPKKMTARDHVTTAITLLVILALIAGAGYGLWLGIGWTWNTVASFFGWLFGGTGGDLQYYCAYKWGSTTSDPYWECISGGWKDWYANAHWMQGR